MLCGYGPCPYGRGKTDGKLFQWHFEARTKNYLSPVLVPMVKDKKAPKATKVVRRELTVHPLELQVWIREIKGAW